MQTIKNSILESIANVVAGLLTSFLIQLVIYPMLKIPVSINQNIIITTVFFVASVIRGFVIRRIFNQLRK